MFNKICKFFNTGYCKLIQCGCPYNHPTLKCNNITCDSKCGKRPPKMCRYKEKCKHKNCQYKHETLMDKDEEIKQLKCQVEQLKEKLKNTQSRMKNLEEKNSQIDNKKQYKSNHTGAWITPYKCAICVYKFSTEDKLKIHIKDEHPIKCSKCDFKFKNKQRLDNHTKVAHTMYSKCTYCEKKFKDQEELQFHRKLHMNKSRVQTIDQVFLTCSNCSQKFSDIMVMKKHMKKEHKFKCKKCPKAFKEKLAFNMHKNTSHRQKNVETSNCITPTSGAISLDTAPRVSQGSSEN